MTVWTTVSCLNLVSRWTLGDTERPHRRTTKSGDPRLVPWYRPNVVSSDRTHCRWKEWDTQERGPHQWVRKTTETWDTLRLDPPTWRDKVLANSTNQVLRLPGKVKRTDWSWLPHYSTNDSPVDGPSYYLTVWDVFTLTRSRCAFEVQIGRTTPSPHTGRLRSSCTLLLVGDVCR